MTVDFGNATSVGVNRRGHALARALDPSCPDGLIKTIPACRSVTLHLDPPVQSTEALGRSIRSRAAGKCLSSLAGRSGKVWTIAPG